MVCRAAPGNHFNNLMNSLDDQIGAAELGRSRLDLYAAGLSALCLIHCLAAPLIVIMIPVMAETAQSELTHQVLAFIAVPVSLLVIWQTLAAHGNKLFITAALTGVGLLLTAVFVEAMSAHAEQITIVGALLLSSAHLWRWTRQPAWRALRLRDNAE